MTQLTQQENFRILLESVLPMTRRAPNNKLGQKTVDSASEVTWKIGPSLGGDSQTCKNRELCFCLNRLRLPFCSCSCSVVMLAIDLKNPHCKHSSCAQTARENKGISTCFGILHPLFHMFCPGLFQFRRTKCQTAQFAFLEFEHCSWWSVSVPRLWFRFVSKTRLFPEILIVHICRTPFAKTTNWFSWWSSTTGVEQTL